MKLLVFGSRTMSWEHMDKVFHEVKALAPTEIIHGDANGADTLGKLAGLDMKIAVTAFPADWKTHGKRAGPVRNQQMLEAKPDQALGFHPESGITPGTLDMYRRLVAAGVPVKLVTYKES